MASQIRKGALLSYTTVAFNAIAGLLYTPWMISCIGPSDYGLYTLSLSIINLFLIDFGLGTAVARFMSKYRAENDSVSARQFLGLAYKFYLIIDIIIFIALLCVFLFIDIIYANLSPSDLDKFKVLYIIVAAYSVLSFPMLSYDGVLTSEEEFVALNGLNLLQRVTNILLIVAFLILGYGVFSLVVVNAGTVIVFRLLKYLFIRFKTSVRADFRSKNRDIKKQVIGFSVWATLFSISSRFSFTLMPSILAALSSTWEIALFGLAASLEGYFYTVASALGNMFMPKVSRALVQENAREELQQLMERVGRVQIIIIGGLFLIFFGTGRSFVNCWVGDAYSILYVLALVLFAPSLIGLPQSVGDTAVVAIGAMKQKSIVYLVTGLVSIVLGLVLCGPFGSLGGCIAICVAYFVRTAGMNFLYVKMLRIDIAHFFMNVFGKWALPAASTVLVAVVLSIFFSFTGWIGFALESAVLFLFYVLCIWLMYSNEEEKSLVLSIRDKLFR